MSPQHTDAGTTSRINRDELVALIRRARDNGAHANAAFVTDRRGAEVVVHRQAVAAWLHANK